ncbi:MAG: endonuclease domain-containing protein [Sphingomonadaceae bacterium]
MRNHSPETLKRARKQRREMYLPEVLLWIQLKQHPGGLKFRKLHPCGEFVADFYCDSAKLVIEVDGISHDMGDQPEYDAARDAWFLSQGIRTLRIPAVHILKTMDDAIALILAAADAAFPPPSVLRTATSPGGGGFSVEY